MTFSTPSNHKSTTSKPVSCYIIGEGKLTLFCAQFLFRSECHLLGVVSPSPALASWAKTNAIPYFRTVSEALPTLQAEPFDYLFSIENSTIVKKQALQLPRRLAINYHNSIAYGGLHAVSWALLNREKYHGITWHTMTEQIDKGAIVQQTIVPIGKKESAIDLDLKCRQLGKQTFPQLVNAIQHDEISLQPWHRSQASYFSQCYKPYGYGLISWDTSVQQIDHLFRATQYAGYDNTFILPKALLQGCIVIPQALTVSQKTVHQPPGTLLYSTENEMTVAAKDGVVHLKNFLTPEGLPFSFHHETNAILKDDGWMLPMPSHTLLENLKYVADTCAKHEKFWLTQIKSLNSFSVPDSHPPLHHATKKLPRALLPQTIALPRTLQALSDKAPLSDVMLTVLYLLLYRINNYENGTILLKHKINDDNDDAATPLSAIFSTTLPVAISLAPTDNFASALTAVQSAQANAQSHHTFSRDIFQRYTALSNTPLSAIAYFDPDGNDKQQAPCSQALMTFRICQKKHVLTYAINPTMRTGYYDTLLENIPTLIIHLATQIANNPSSSIHQLSLLTEKEHEKIIHQWNDTKTAYAKHKNIAVLFEEQVAQTPNNLALTYRRTTLTYEKLNQRANQVVACLQKHGVTLGTPVGLCLRSPLDFVVSILGILKIGGVYVPIDPHPKNRMRYIMQDAAVKVMITDPHYYEKVYAAIEDNKTATTSILNYKGIARRHHSKHCPDDAATHYAADTAAYIMYTSGTTGNPKGVSSKHHAIHRLVKNNGYLTLSEEDIIAQAANLTFDAATFEIWGALLSGAHLVCVDKDNILDPKYFESFLKRHDVSVLWLTTVLFDRYVAYSSTMFRHIEHLIVGGDVLNPTTVKTVFKHPETRPQEIINGYGPTENTTFTCTYSIPDDVASNQPIPIGKPIANTTLYILDKYNNPMPIDVPGELCAAGDGLSTGYLNLPALTQAAFVENIFSAESEKMYKTGDFVKWDPQGLVHFLGRQDNQVKISGFRVEISAIEQAILAYPNVAQALVISNGRQYKKFLSSYIVLQDREAGIAISGLRQYLLSYLPYYMVPATYFILEEIPLNQHDKIDRARLPLPEKNQRYLTGTLIKPRNTLESELSALWTKILHVDDVGVHDSFFSLGGHSLLMTDMMMQVDEHYHINIPFKYFLKNPTIAHLANLIENPYVDDQSVDALLNDAILALPKQDIRLLAPNDPPRHILLTGATSFLGQHLLCELLAHTQATIFCLVRGDNQAHTKQRLLKALKQNKLLLPSADLDRIQVVKGNLDDPLLGLTTSDYEKLGKQVDAIYHNAAEVNHLYSYEQLKSANVESTLELLRLSLTHKKKQFHFMSTLSAVNDIDKQGMLLEADSQPTAPNIERLTNGYAQTKWVSECLLTQAKKLDLDVTIYRPSWVAGRTDTGDYPPEKNHLFSLLKGCLQLGTAPNWECDVNLFPVDTLSEYIVGISLNKKLRNHVYNMVNAVPVSWPDIIRTLQALGSPIQLISPETWREKMLPKVTKGNALYPLLPLYLTQHTKLDTAPPISVPDVHYVNFQHAVTTLSIPVPAINKPLLTRYLTYLIETKFINLSSYQAADQ